MDIQFSSIHIDLSLFKALSPGVRRLAAEVVLKSGQFFRSEFPNHPALHHTPEPTVPGLYSKHSGADLGVYAVLFSIPVHKAALLFLRHPVFDEGTQNLVFILQEGSAIPFLAGLINIAPLIPAVEVGGQGHIELEQSGFGRLDGETILPNGQR